MPELALHSLVTKFDTMPWLGKRTATTRQSIAMFCVKRTATIHHLFAMFRRLTRGGLTVFLCRPRSKELREGEEDVDDGLDPTDVNSLLMVAEARLKGLVNGIRDKNRVLSQLPGAQPVSAEDAALKQAEAEKRASPRSMSEVLSVP